MVRPHLDRLLEQGAAALDIPEELAEEATLKYESVAAWLGDESSPLHRYSPDLYPQGSFRLGTPIRPLLRREEFDIDLVCQLAIPKEHTTQKDLKTRVGSRLREDEELSHILEEKRRCWTLRYTTKFHLDILPAIPDTEVGGDSILLTDRDLTRWQHSNPIGYADWFLDRIRPMLVEQLGILAKEAGVDVEEIPRWRVRTPLQRTVQLLKRHRDHLFPLDADDRPTSIIITTLAARAYREQRGVFSALLEVVRAMPTYIENRDGKWWVPNPAHPEENFADKWNEKPVRTSAFLRWLKQVEANLVSISSVTNDADASRIIDRYFGSGSSARPPAAPVAVPDLADESHTVHSRWPVRIKYGCEVRGWIYPGVRRGKRLWELTSRPVPRNVGLRFEATTNVPPDYEVQWQVVNTGAEARAANQLRGGFELSETGRPGVRWERTAYVGTHWVEAFVVKDGICVARSGRKYVRIRG